MNEIWLSYNEMTPMQQLNCRLGKYMIQKKINNIWKYRID